MLRQSLLCLVALLLLAALTAGAGRRRDSRVHDSSPSDVEHHDESDEDRHDDDGDDERHGDRHDAKYDHESFLGREESRRLDKMSPEESKKRLAELFVKVDKNNDSQISEAEMEAWLAEIARQSREKEVETRFREVKTGTNAKDMNSSISFDEWKQVLQKEVMGDDLADKEAEPGFHIQVARGRARWDKADANGDKKLDKKELADFMHPEHSPRMKDVVLAEAMNLSDLNRDGKVELVEYMSDVYPNYEKLKKEGKKLPDWVATDEEIFKKKLDLNKDGVLDADEVFKWVVPDDIDHTKKETKHLFKVADENKDKFLSKDEVMKSWETFVGHQATHYGEFEQRHEEL